MFNCQFEIDVTMDEIMKHNVTDNPAKKVTITMASFDEFPYARVNTAKQGSYEHPPIAIPTIAHIA